jgi:hypothetical protein
VSCACVYYAGFAAFGKRRGFLCGVVGQAEENDIGFIDEPFPFAEVFTFIGIYLKQFDIIAFLQTFVYLQACRSLLAVYEYFV